MVFVARVTDWLQVFVHRIKRKLWLPIQPARINVQNYHNLLFPQVLKQPKTIKYLSILRTF